MVALAKVAAYADILNVATFATTKRDPTLKAKRSTQPTLRSSKKCHYSIEYLLTKTYGSISRRPVAPRLIVLSFNIPWTMDPPFQGGSNEQIAIHHLNQA